MTHMAERQEVPATAAQGLGGVLFDVNGNVTIEDSSIAGSGGNTADTQGKQRLCAVVQSGQYRPPAKHGVLAAADRGQSFRNRPRHQPGEWNGFIHPCGSA